MIRIELDQDVATFLRHAGPWLEEKAALHSQLLSIAERMAQNGRPAHLLVRARDEAGKPAASGMQTDADRPILFSWSKPENARDLAVALAQAGKSLPGVVGPVQSADAFSGGWHSTREGKPELISNMRLFELRAVKPPPSPGGLFRAAELRDENLLFDWLSAFHEEAIPHDPRRSEEEVRLDIREAVAKEQYFLWEHGGRPVCLVGSRRETRRERWIAPVYTPSEERGKGYGMALVAAVSARIVAGGKNAALFTDLANPVSNSIYPKVGYEPVADFRHWRFPLNAS